MCYTGLFKRIIPFALTFAAGLFLASFFVSIAFPGANWRANRRVNRFHEMQQLRIENEQLREMNRELRMQNEKFRQNFGSDSSDVMGVDAITPEDFDAHHPPPPPKRPKQPRFDTLQ
jgi:hypothetical protein